MDPAVAVLTSLVLTSLMLMLMLAIAWATFGRPRHALFWAAMLGARTLAWGVSLGGRFMEAGWGQFLPIADGLSVGASVLLLLGFRDRAGLPLRIAPLAGVALACLAATFVGVRGRPDELLAVAPTLAFTAYCVGSAAAIVMRQPNADLVHRTAGIGLSIFALVYGATALFATLLLAAGSAPLPLLRLMILIGIPAAATGGGLICLFLIAGDLALQMKRLASIDPLTGAFNRRGLDQASGALIALCRRQGQPLTIVLADLDRFKQINDRFGHSVGDAVLCEFVRHAAKILRRGDIIARLGGEEFVILLGNTAPERARDAVERLRAGLPAIAQDRIAPLSLTSSFGIASVEPDAMGVDAAIERADRALYRSKQGGRDRITLDAPPLQSEPVAA